MKHEIEFPFEIRIVLSSVSLLLLNVLCIIWNWSNWIEHDSFIYFIMGLFNFGAAYYMYIKNVSKYVNFIIIKYLI